SPSSAGLAPRHITYGVTTQKFGIGEPRSFGHPVGAIGIDEDGKPPIRSTNNKENAGLQGCASSTNLQVIVALLTRQSRLAFRTRLRSGNGPETATHRLPTRSLPAPRIRRALARQLPSPAQA